MAEYAVNYQRPPVPGDRLVVKTGTMSIKASFGRRHAAAARREQLLVQLERSGLSAAEFIRQHGLNYTTFWGWRKRWERAKALRSFVQVEVAPCAGAEGLVIELGNQARIHIHSQSRRRWRRD